MPDEHIVESSDDLDAAMRVEHRDHLHAVRFIGPAGSVAAAGVLVALVWSDVSHGRFVVWFAVVVALSALMVASFSIDRSMAWTDAEGTPKLSLLAHLAMGTAWGAALWIDPAALSGRATTMSMLAVLFAVTAGAVGGIQPSAMLARLVLVPMWTLAVIGLAVADEAVLAIGSFVFLSLVLSDLHAGAALFRGAIRFRLASEASARIATDEARRDALTGLPNRSGLEEGVEAILALGVEAVTVLFVDLDNFKDINDRFGHHAGDAVLHTIAERLRSRTDSATVVARFGGDEFFIAVPECLSADALSSMTSRLIAVIEEPITVQGQGYASVPQVAMVSASIGTSSLPAARFDIERAYLEADQALYDAKGQGRRRARSFDASHGSPTVGIASRLREALSTQAIQWWAQPVFDITTGGIEAVELLARWSLPDGSTVAPSEFIPVADTSGLIGDLSRQALQAAASTLDGWRDHPVLNDTAVSVNLSPRYLTEGTLIEDLACAFSPLDVAQGRLWLEITESHDLTGMAEIEESLAAAARLGALIVVDDFGTGYTSVRQLFDLPVSIVKLDRWLAEDLDTTDSRAGLARAVQSVAISLGHRTVAEGIERVTQIAPIRDLGIDLVQGYLFAAPMPLPQFHRSAHDLRAAAATDLVARSSRL